MRHHARFVFALFVFGIVSGPLAAQGVQRVSVLVEMAPGAPRNAIRSFAAAQGGHVRYEYSILPRVLNLRNIPVPALNGLRNLPGVVRITQDPVIKANLHESAVLIRALQSQIQAAGLSASGAGVRICVTDTGIDSNHWMFQDWPDTTQTRIDYAAAQNYISPGIFPEDDHGHGAHVSGIAAGREGLFFNSLPLQGIAPKATIIPVKVLDSTGQGDGSNLIAAFQHCTSPDLPGGPAKVISVSLGYGPFSDRATCDAEDVVAAANAAVDAGAVIVAASGNDGNADGMSAPACGSKVISVGATWDYTGFNLNDYFYCLAFATVDTVLCFSNKSPMLDVVAPGCSIHSAAADLINDAPNAVTAMCGTSQATPHVSGLAALLLQQNPGLTPAAVRDCIRNGAVDKGPAGFDPAYGYGRIDAVNSLTLCSPTGPPNQPPTAGFTYSCTGFACNFTSTSTDTDGAINSTSWNFGDGASGSGPTTSHTYATGGNYNVVLTVTDDDGATAQQSQSVRVNNPPTASFTYSCTDLACNFDGTGSSDPGGTILSYVWSFGDGGTGSGSTTSHTYSTAGTRIVTLTVTDNDGAVDDDSKSVTVSTPAPSIPTAPSNLNVSVTSTGTGKKLKYTANLSWTDNSGNETSFAVQRYKLGGRRGQQTCAFEIEFTLPANSTSYADTGATTATCKYGVAARNTAGTSAFVEKTVTIQ